MGSGKICIVGVGPGDRGLLTLKAAELLARADVVAGFRPALEVVEQLVVGKRVVVLDYRNQDQEIGGLLGLAAQGWLCVVCAYGDPSVSDSQFVGRFVGKGVEVEVVPGVSSVLAVCAKLGVPFERALLVTFHKSGPIEQEKCELSEFAKAGKRYVLVFPRPWDFMPQRIAEFLVGEGVEPDRRVAVVEKATLPGEKVSHGVLGCLAATRGEFSELSVVVVWPKTQPAG